MNHYNKELKMYAVAGLRTVEDWSASGRNILAGSEPQAEAAHRGKPVSLFSRTQTEPKPRDRGNVKPVASESVPS